MLIFVFDFKLEVEVKIINNNFLHKLERENLNLTH